MQTIEQIISTNADAILDTWAEEAKRSAGARGLTRPELMNIMPRFLRSLARAGDGEARREQAELLESHLSSRLRAGFNLEELLEEIAILSRAIAHVWAGAAAEERPGAADIDRLLADLQAASALVTHAFREYLAEDEQTEKRVLRLVSEPFVEPPDGDEPLSTARLTKALQVVMEAMDAATAALLLHDRRTGELFLAASVGLAAEPFRAYVREVDKSSFAGTVASCEEATALRDVETTPLDVPDALRRSGIHSLLGIRLPAQRLLSGIVYVGLRETRAFSTREMRRIEAIGERLALHLDNARLYAELIEQLDALRIERRLRSQFVSVLAHDLRGPLAAARLAVTLLAADPGMEKKRRDTALRNLDRVDRMVTDLLDVERIQAGRRLPLTREDGDLAAIVREAMGDFEAEHPGRFALRAGEEIHGAWDASALRRALWNLVSNALKYGAAGAPITVTLARAPAGVALSVHNEGPPIPEEAQATLFDPFTRAAGDGAAPGWGLGLSLVRGVAEAHDGSVHVDSAPGRGTTFTLRLPLGASGG